MQFNQSTPTLILDRGETALEAFQYAGQEMRTAELEGKPAIVVSDIGKILGYRDASSAARVLRDHQKGYTEVRTPGGAQRMLVTTIEGFNRLIIKSNASNADDVQDWLTDEVMPSIQQTGSYGSPALPDLTTPEGVLALAQTLTKTAEELVATKHAVAELEPLAAQARTFNLGKGLVTRQDFAREIVTWGLSEGFQVTSPQVMEFLGRKLDMFIVGERSDHGQSTLSGERRGLSTTSKGVSPANGYAYATGKLTPKGVEYAWARIESYVRANGHLRSRELTF